MEEYGKRLSDMSREELLVEMDRLKQQGQELFDADNLEEAMVVRTRWYLAASYLMNPNEIEIGTQYFVEGEPEGLFTVTHLDGVMAHGLMTGKPFSVAYPISMLSKEAPID